VRNGGVVWRHGGIYNRTREVNALIPISKMGQQNKATSISSTCASSGESRIRMEGGLKEKYMDRELTCISVGLTWHALRNAYRLI
jgi:hypothetical protein